MTKYMYVEALLNKTNQPGKAMDKLVNRRVLTLNVIYCLHKITEREYSSLNLTMENS